MTTKESFKTLVPASTGRSCWWRTWGRSV